MTKINSEGQVMTIRDWKWMVGILIGIIVFILSYKFWGKSGELTDIISIGSGLVSIALAIVAIIISISESIKGNVKEEKVNEALDSITYNLNTMKGLIDKLDKDNSKTHKGLSKIEDYISGLQSINQLNTQSKVEVEENNKLTEVGNSPTQQDMFEKKQYEKECQLSENIQTNTTGILKRGDVFFADLSPVVGSEQGGVRPVLIITNDIANRFSSSINVAAITGQFNKAKLPTHVEINSKKYGFDRDSVILLEHTRTIDKSRLIEKITHLDGEIMDKVDEALSIQLGLIEF